MCTVDDGGGYRTGSCVVGSAHCSVAVTATRRTALVYSVTNKCVDGTAPIETICSCNGGDKVDAMFEICYAAE